MEQVRIDFLVTGNLSSLQTQVQALNASLMQSAGSVNLLDRSFQKLDVQAIQRGFAQSLVASNQFDHQMVSLRSHTEGYGTALDRANVSGRKLWGETKTYMRSAGGEIRALAKEQIRLQNSVVTPLGRTPTGAMNVGVNTPTGLNTDVATNLRVANKEWEIFNRNAQLGATQMVNVGKNVQWAGRQLMVGFTVPLMMAGGLAAKTFYDLDQSLIQLQKVYGSGLTFGDDFKKQSEQVRVEAEKMAMNLAQTYGQAGVETVDLMGQLAAAGYDNIGDESLNIMTEQVTRLATLGDMATADAATASIALQTAFDLPVEQLKETVDFMNAVENQTSLSLDDIVEAIPRAGTVIKGLGGDVQDLTLLLTAMKEGGVSAAEGANALKSGLSSMISPPNAAVEFLKEMGINLPKIIANNPDDIVGSILELQEAMKGLTNLEEQQAITKLFGKYQFARMGALFDNLGKKGSQTQKVMELTAMSLEDLGTIAEQELATKLESASKQFDRVWQTFKLSTAGIGEQFLKAGTQILEWLGNIMGWFNKHDLARTIAGWGLAFLAVIGPIVMVAGLFTNLAGTLVKAGLRVANMFKVLASNGGVGKQFELLTVEGVAANRQLELMSSSLYKQEEAELRLRTATELMEQQYITLGSAAATARVETELLTEAQIQQATGTGRYGPSIKNINGQDYQLAHRVPANMTDADKGRVIEWLGMTRPGAVTSIPDNQTVNFGKFDASYQSVEANQTAKNFLPYIYNPSMTVPGDLTDKQRGQMPGAAVNVDAYIADIQRIFKDELGSAEAAALWMDRHEQGLRQVASGTVGLHESQQRLFAATEGAHQIATSDQFKLYSIQKDLIADDSGSTKALRGQAERGIQALNSSVAQVDQDMHRLGTSAVHASAELNALDLTAEQKATNDWKVAVDRSRNNFAALDSALDKTEAGLIDLGNGFSAVNPEEMDAHMEKLESSLIAFDVNARKAAEGSSEAAAVVDRANLSFVAVENANGRYLSAVDKATGKVYATINQSGRNVTSSATSVNAAASDQAVMASMAAADRMAVQSKATMYQTMDILTSSLTAEEQINALRKNGLMTEQGKLAIESAELGIEEQQYLEDTKQLAQERLATAEEAKQAALARSSAYDIPAGAPAGYRSPYAIPTGASPFPQNPGSPLSGVWNGIKAVPNKSMYAGGALMGGAMMGSMMLPEGGGSNIANMTMMGAGVGGMMGPWGLAIGGVAGLITGGLMEAFKSSAEEAKRQAEIAAAEWEGEFGRIDLSQEVADSLKLGKLDVFIRPELDILGLGIPVETASEQYSATVSEQMAGEIEELNKMEDSASVIAYGENLFNNLVARGAEAADAIKLVRELMSQTDNMASYVEMDIDIGIDEKGAEEKVREGLKAVLDDATAKAFSDYDPNSYSTQKDKAWEDVGEKSGEAYFNGLQNALETGAIKSKDYFNAAVAGAETVGGGLLNTAQNGEMDAILNPDGSVNVNARQKLWDLGLEGSTIDELAASYNKLTDEQKEYFDANSEFSGEEYGDNGFAPGEINTEQAVSLNWLTKSITESGDAYSDYLARIAEADPEIEALAGEIYDLGQAQTMDEAIVMALKRANDLLNESLREQNLLTSFTNSAYKYMPEPEGLEKTNIAQLQRQQEREMETMQEHEDDKLEALQEAEDQRLENMQKAADKRERLMQREIDQVSRAYDRQIADIERAEEKRQEEADAEEERFQRRQEIRNMEISYDEAIANGDLYEAARIRMDMDAKRRQRDRASEEERLQAKADKKIKGIEKEQRQEIRLMEKALRIEERMNERAIESAQEASDAKIEAAQEAADARIEAEQKANEKEIRLAEKTNGKIEKNQENSNARIKKAFDALQNGNLDKFEDIMDKLKIYGEDRMSLLMEFSKKKFGALPDQAWSAVSGAIKSGDWQLLGELMTGKIAGMNKDQLADIANKFGNAQGIDNPGPAPDARAAGGFISGPGGGTSDSIPARLSNGEYVIKQSKVAKYGKSFFDRLNDGPAHFAEGGMVGPVLQGIMSPALSTIMGVVNSAMSGFAVSGAEPGKYGDTMMSAEQLKNAATIISVGSELGMAKREIISGLMTAMQESMLRNVNYGDRDSLGLFQQRSTWGSAEQRMDPTYAATQYFKRLKTIQDRDEMTLGEMAQAVQISAFPSYYTQWADEARAIMAATGTTQGMPGGLDGGKIVMMDGEPVDKLVAAQLRIAGKILGQMFSVTQGSYQPETSYSGTTHTGGGVIDTPSYGTDSVIALQKAGFAAWYRGPGAPGSAANYPAHIHAISLFSKNLDEAAAYQRGHYVNMTGDGLGNAYYGPHAPMIAGLEAKLPSLKVGGKINYDNTIANLHRGEAVLTAPLTSAFEKNVANGGGSTYNFNVDKIELHKELDLEREFSKFVVKHERRQDRRNGRSYSI